MLGRNVRLPIDLIYCRPEEEPIEQRTPFVKDLLESLEVIHEFAQSQLRMSCDRMKFYYVYSLQGKTLQVGDQVWCFKLPTAEKGNYSKTDVTMVRRVCSDQVH